MRCEILKTVSFSRKVSLGGSKNVHLPQRRHYVGRKKIKSSSCGDFFFKNMELNSMLRFVKVGMDVLNLVCSSRCSFGKLRVEKGVVFGKLCPKMAQLIPALFCRFRSKIGGKNVAFDFGGV